MPAMQTTCTRSVPRNPKPYRRHNCVSAHRTFRTTAACIWPRATWILGEGPFATVSWCHRGATVMLHADIDQARDALAAIDNLACGGRCRRSHDLIVLSVGPGQVAA